MKIITVIRIIAVASYEIDKTVSRVHFIKVVHASIQYDVVDKSINC